MQIDFDNKNSLQEIISILLDGYVPTQLDYFDTGILADADSIQEMLDDLSYNLTKNVELVKDKEVEQDMEKD